MFKSPLLSFGLLSLRLPIVRRFKDSVPDKIVGSMSFFSASLDLFATSLSVSHGIVRLTSNSFPHPRDLTTMKPDQNSSKAPFVLFFRNTAAENLKHLSAEQRQQLIVRWNDWYDSLHAQGKASNGQPLEEATRVVSGAGGQRIADGPYPESKEAIGGYVMLHVDSIEEATRHAQRHPGLNYGMQIEIRQMITECHLGIKSDSLASTKEG
jgi:hypothetical protein